MYVGELAANSLLDSATHTLETEGEQYRALDSSSQPDMFSFLRTLVERSSSRGEQIRSSLLDPMLADKMIGQLQDRTGRCCEYGTSVFLCCLPLPCCTTNGSAANSPPIQSIICCVVQC